MDAEVSVATSALSSILGCTTCIIVRAQNTGLGVQRQRLIEIPERCLMIAESPRLLAGLFEVLDCFGHIFGFTPMIILLAYSQMGGLEG